MSDAAAAKIDATALMLQTALSKTLEESLPAPVRAQVKIIRTGERRTLRCTASMGAFSAGYVCAFCGRPLAPAAPEVSAAPTLDVEVACRACAPRLRDVVEIVARAVCKSADREEAP